MHENYVFYYIRLYDDDAARCRKYCPNTDRQNYSSTSLNRYG